MLDWKRDLAKDLMMTLPLAMFASSFSVYFCISTANSNRTYRSGRSWRSALEAKKIAQMIASSRCRYYRKY